MALVGGKIQIRTIYHLRIFILMDKYLGKYYQYNLYDFRVKI